MLDTGTLNHSPIKNSSRLLGGKSYSFYSFFLFFSIVRRVSIGFKSKPSVPFLVKIIKFSFYMYRIILSLIRINDPTLYTVEHLVGYELQHNGSATKFQFPSIKIHVCWYKVVDVCLDKILLTVDLTDYVLERFQSSTAHIVSLNKLPFSTKALHWFDSAPCCI